VVFLIRSVLESAKTYDEAVLTLATTPIPCDCLLLITGTRPGEMAAIERTPSRHAIRHAHRKRLCITNDYLLLDSEKGAAPNELQRSSCGRLERIHELLRVSPGDFETCFAYLSDPNVRMELTVQQMVFRARDGSYAIRIP
jgi:hypothetical protein